MARFVKDEEILAETTRVCEERERSKVRSILAPMNKTPK